MDSVCRVEGKTGLWCSEKNRDEFKEFQIQERALIVMGGGREERRECIGSQVIC